MMFLLQYFTWVICWITFVSLVFQYVFVIKMFFNNEWETKKEFLMHLIPLYPQGYLIKDFAIDVKNKAKETWGKMK